MLNTLEVNTKWQITVHDYYSESTLILLFLRLHHQHISSKKQISYLPRVY